MTGIGAGAGLVVVAATSQVLVLVPEADAILSPPERRRASAFRRPSDRDDFVAAHVLARLCCRAVLGAPLDVDVRQCCTQCGGDHGAPFLPDHPEAGISWSHTSGVVAAAVSATHKVGVDVELVAHHAAATEALAGLGVAIRDDQSELTALTRWVRAEAMIKVGLYRLDDLGTEAESDLPAGDHAILDVRATIAGQDVIAAAISLAPLGVEDLDDLVIS